MVELRAGFRQVLRRHCKALKEDFAAVVDGEVEELPLPAQEAKAPASVTREPISKIPLKSIKTGFSFDVKALLRRAV